MAVSESVRDGGEDYRRQAILRGSKSRAELKVPSGGVAQRVQSMENMRKKGKEGEGERKKEGIINQRPSSSQLRTRPSSSQLNPQQSIQTTQATPAAQATQRPSPSRSTPIPVAQSKNQIAIPTRRQPTSSRKPPPSPSKTEGSIADDWDAELKRDAQYSDLRIRPQASAIVVPRPPAVERGDRDEWEKAAMMIDRRETGRDQEERTRRDPTREIGKSFLSPLVYSRADI